MFFLLPALAVVAETVATVTGGMIASATATTLGIIASEVQQQHLV